MIYFYVSHIDESNLTLEELEEVDCMDHVALSFGMKCDGRSPVILAARDTGSLREGFRRVYG